MTVVPDQALRPGSKISEIVGLTTRTALSEKVMKFGQPPASCLPIAHYEHNVALLIWRRPPGNQALIRHDLDNY